MKKRFNNRGFTLAELLIVVAIMMVLFAVAFVAVQNHQRSMTRLEYDTIAKEIFIAAQNHLTAAESQGYLGEITNEPNYGYPSKFKDGDDDDGDEINKVYYYVVNQGSVDRGVMLDLMLPFGAIDETIRAGGSYIIRYQPSSARVLDVFYSNPGHTAWLTVKGSTLSSNEQQYDSLMKNYRY
jgi:Tfp pilus assembly protein PilE